MRPTNVFISGLVDIVRVLRKALSNNHILVFGARQVGKSTFQKYIMLDSSYFRTPEKTESAQGAETYKIDYLDDSCDTFKIRIQDVAGDRVHWSDTIRRIVNARPRVILFMLRAFEMRTDKQDIKKSEHIMRVPGLMESFRIMKVDDGMGRKKDTWYCGEDMDAFEFLRTLLYDHPNLHKKYPDVMSRCTDIHNKLYRNQKKIVPTHLYMVVNFADILPDDEIKSRTKAVLEPYEQLLIRWSDTMVKIRRCAISARYGYNIEQLLKDIGGDRKWT